MYPLEQKILDAYRQGCIDITTELAVWSNGKQYVGTRRWPLADAIADIRGAPPPGQYTADEEHPHQEIRLVDKSGLVYAWLNRRPHYCNHGRYDCHVAGVYVSEQDSWPRYYFSLVVAQDELLRFLVAHELDVSGMSWIYLRDMQEIVRNPPKFARHIHMDRVNNQYKVGSEPDGK